MQLLPNTTTQLTLNLFIYHGNSNVGILRQGDRSLLIDCGNGAVRPILAELGIRQVERILCTHHHRDSVSGVMVLAGPTTKIGVPSAEEPWFTAVERFWQDPQMRWHLYNIHPHNLMLAESISVHETYHAGDQIHWGAATLTVLDTPGHTDGSVSYLVEVDGQRIVFCGDTICGDGQLWDLYSLQQRGETSTDYHGFLGDRQRLLASLAQILATQPTALVPTHGSVMPDPVAAVSTLRQRLEACYDQYVAISALRYYFPAMFASFAGRPGHLPIREGKPVPEFLRKLGTTWVVIAANREALVMDCGSPAVIQALQSWQASGEITQVTACWVTHYHDDHVDALPDFQAAYPCPTYADRTVAAVVEQPRAWRIPCISPALTRIDHRTADGESWWWNEFRLTAYHFPGQTYYHGGLLVEGQGRCLFFSGDSFTPAGIDDYCAGNRNLLGAGVGYDRCLALIEQIQPTHIFNCHVPLAFDFTAAEIRWMRHNLAEREQTFGALTLWDHANYGLDEHWLRCFPYEQDVVAGQTVRLQVAVTNHSATAKVLRCRPILPKRWGREVAEQQVEIPAKQNGFLPFIIAIPHRAAEDLTVAESFALPGTLPEPQARRVVIPVEVSYDGRSLGQFREAIFILHPQAKSQFKQVAYNIVDPQMAQIHADY